MTRRFGHAFARGASLLFTSRREGRAVVLLARRAAWVADPGVWGTAGGHQDPGDADAWACAVREAGEEFCGGEPLDRFLRRDLRSPGVAGVLGPFGCWPIPHRVFILPLASPPPAWPRLNAEHEEARWWPLTALPKPVAWLPLLALRRSSFAGLERPSRAVVWRAFRAEVGRRRGT